jgi:hypothetical protein
MRRSLLSPEVIYNGRETLQMSQMLIHKHDVEGVSKEKGGEGPSSEVPGLWTQVYDQAVS